MPKGSAYFSLPKLAGCVTKSQLTFTNSWALQLQELQLIRTWPVTIEQI